MTLSRAYESFDPYLGNLLDTFQPQNANDSAFLIFPTGETNQDLSESLTYAEDSTGNVILSDYTYISYAEPQNIFFKPLREPFYKFLTPVRQALVSKRRNDLSNGRLSTHIVDQG